MVAAFLITFREIIEASFIVATLLGVLTVLKEGRGVRTVWAGIITAVIVSGALILLAGLAGIQIQKIYSGKTEESIEGVLMVVSSLFITWAVFFLHSHMAGYKKRLLHTVHNSSSLAQRSLFVLAFTAVLREGFEIVLFLSTIYLSSDPSAIFSGFSFGVIAGLFISILIFNSAVRLPIGWVVRTSTILLVLFAAGILSRGVHELAEAGILPEFAKVTIVLLPAVGTFAADLIKSLFGLTRQMDYLQMGVYIMYLAVMIVLLRRATTVAESSTPLTANGESAKPLNKQGG